MIIIAIKIILIISDISDNNNNWTNNFLSINFSHLLKYQIFYYFFCILNFLYFDANISPKIYKAKQSLYFLSI
ncbi:unnamed protein product [Brugia timori]|uniref:Uncharacterized protein n=1 Tax=Brugia timori TaxID=42155 RepID=A0A0R3QXT5_9BILA|nr:unnamed protein product [Brugia timori]